MTIVQIEWFFVLFCIITFIYQICLLHFLRVKENRKNWSCFLGANIAIFIATPIAMRIFGGGADGLSSAVFMLMICIPTFVFNTVLLITGIILKKRKMASTNSLIVIINTIVVFLCSLFVLSIIPSHLDKTQEEKGRLIAEQFLINKYGDHNYKFEKGNKHYQNYGMWDKEFAGYTYTVKADCIKDDDFTVEVSENNYVKQTDFLQVYFSQQLNLNYKTQYGTKDFDELEDYLRQEEGLERFDIYELNDFVESYSSKDGVEYDDAYYIVYKNNGRIPTIEEFKEALKELEEIDRQ